ncbi:MAG: hypothetical protein M0Z54_10230 [Thermaerobacter sp.]|nr:hypothetical protein [Thermaerobacter sp.]
MDDHRSMDSQRRSRAVSSGARRGPTSATPDPNRAEWLDLAHTDQAFEEWPAVVEDSSLGLTLTEAEPVERRAARRCPGR